MLRTTAIALLFLSCLLLPIPQMHSQGHYLNWSKQTDLPGSDVEGSSASLIGPYSGVHNEALIVVRGYYVTPYDIFGPDGPMMPSELDSGWVIENDSGLVNAGDSGLMNAGDSGLSSPVDSGLVHGVDPGYHPERSWGYFSDIHIGRKGDDGKLYWVTERFPELDQSLAHGFSVSTPIGLLCIGIDSIGGSLPMIQLLQWDPDLEKLSLIRLQSIPARLTTACGALAGNTVYVSGMLKGQSGNQLFSLDISSLDTTRQWKVHPGLPGPARNDACAAVQADGVGQGLYVFGGFSAEPGEESEPLNDTWRYDPGSQSWKQMSDIEVDGKPYYPAYSPAVDAGVHHILIFGPYDGAGMLDHRHILAYHTITNTWAMVDTFPEHLPISTSADWFDGNIVLPGGNVARGLQRSSTVWEFIPIPAPAGLRWLDYAVIILYLIILVWMGAHFAKRGKTTKDYFTAGKRIPWWAAGISIFGTSLSAITYMAVPAKAFGTDWTYTFLSISQILTVPIVIWLVLPFFRRLNVTTAYEYLERRFHVVVRVIGGLAFILFQFGRIGIVLFLPAIALSVVTGVDIYTCIIVMAVLSIFYTVLGGIEAVIWTDVKQVVVLTIGAIVCLILMMTGIDGGFDTLVDIAADDLKLRLADLNFDFNSPTLWVILGGGIGTNLINQTSDQTFVQRYLTVKSEKAARWSLATPAFLVIPVSILFFGLGTALYGFYKTNPGELNPVLENADAIFPWYIISQLPQGLSGLLIAGIFAASMSSLDSSLNSSATVITSDLYKRFVPGRVDKHYLAVAKVVTVFIGLAGMLFALALAGFEIKSLWDEFSKVLGLFAGGLAGLFLLGMSSRRATTGGALIGFLASAGVQYWVSSTGAVHFLLYTFTGVASCYVVGWLASWAFPKKKELHGLTIGTIREVQSSN